MRGKYIMFEGTEGCGKGTQMRLAKDYLISKNIETIVVREPGGDLPSELIRCYVKDIRRTYEALQQAFREFPDYRISTEAVEEDFELDSLTEAFLFFAARRQGFIKNIKPGLESGKIVLADRGLWSSVVYQGYLAGNGDQRLLDYFDRSHRFMLEGNFPDKTFLLDIDIAETIRRVNKAKGRSPGDKWDNAIEKDLETIRKGYLELAKQNQDQFIVIDGSKEPERIFEEDIKPELDKLL